MKRVAVRKQGALDSAPNPTPDTAIREDRRKVILWSREPWQSVDDVGADSLPPGRFVSGITQTSVGAVRVVGVCIPWFGSRTEARRKSERKQRWEDHAQYLAGLRELLARDSATRLIVMGDFNQMMGPGSRAPETLQRALREVFPPGMSIATAALTFQGRGSIDHIAVSEDSGGRVHRRDQQRPRRAKTVRPLRSRGGDIRVAAP